jgi:hypothetical protein
MFIKDLYAISSQSTHDLEFEGGAWQEQYEKYYAAIEPSYQNLIPANLLRRMGKAVRMGIGSGLPLLQRNEATDGIIIGSANGGMEDCIQFLNQIVDYEEGTLTPTNFVNSTPNSLAGQLAIMTKNTGYNMTHVNGSLSFENALLDGMLFFEDQHQSASLLIGAVEEVSVYNYNIDLLAGRFKSEITPNSKLISTQSNGSICGEGSTMFIVSNNPQEAIARVVDISQITTTSFDDVHAATAQLLEKNGLLPEMIDLLILGRNGDVRTDHWYDQFSNKFKGTPSICYKHMCGEYRTSSAFACYMASQLYSGKFQNHTHFIGEIPSTFNYVLIYNHFDGERHGLILMQAIKH